MFKLLSRIVEIAIILLLLWAVINPEAAADATVAFLHQIGIYFRKLVS